MLNPSLGILIVRLEFLVDLLGVPCLFMLFNDGLAHPCGDVVQEDGIRKIALPLMNIGFVRT